MSSTVIELRTAPREDILLMGEGHLSMAQDEGGAARLSIARSLFGVLPATMTFEEAKEERMKEL